MTRQTRWSIIDFPMPRPLEPLVFSIESGSVALGVLEVVRVEQLSANDREDQVRFACQDRGSILNWR